MTIGESLPKLLDDITELILVERDLGKVKELREQQKKIAAELQKLIDKNVSQDTSEYKAVINGIEEAHEAVKAAIEDLGKVAETIGKIAKVIGLLAKVAAMAA